VPPKRYRIGKGKRKGGGNTGGGEESQRILVISHSQRPEKKGVVEEGKNKKRRRGSNPGRTELTAKVGIKIFLGLLGAEKKQKRGEEKDA